MYTQDLCNAHVIITISWTWRKIFPLLKSYWQASPPEYRHCQYLKKKCPLIYFHNNMFSDSLLDSVITIHTSSPQSAFDFHWSLSHRVTPHQINSPQPSTIHLPCRSLLAPDKMSTRTSHIWQIYFIKHYKYLTLWHPRKSNQVTPDPG